MSDNLGLPITLQPKQRQVLLSDVDQLFYGGGRNCGKSTIANWLIYAVATYYWQHKIPAEIVVFRRLGKQLSGGLMQMALSSYPWPRDFFLSSMRPGAWRLPIYADKKGPGGMPIITGYVRVRYLQAEHPDDVYEYIGENWALLVIDQIEEWTGEMVEVLMTNVRTADPRIRPLCRFFGNWGGPCHQWLVKNFLEPVDQDGNPIHATIGQPFSVPFKVEVGGQQFVKEVTRLCLIGKFTENPHIDQAAYAAQLKQTSPHLWKAWGEADPFAFEGQMYGEWDKRLHVVEPFPIPPEWEHLAGVDYGITAPFCALFAAREPQTKRLYVYHEIYQRGLRAESQMERLVQYARSQAFHIRRFACDSQMWARESNGLAPIDFYRRKAQELKFPVTLVQAEKNRIANVQLVHRYLATWADGKPGLQVFATCRNLIHQLPAMQPDPHNPEDVLTKRFTEDHAHEALMYLLSTLRENPTQPVGYRLEQRAQRHSA